MAEVSYQSAQGIQYGVSDHVLGLIYIILRDRSKDIPSSIRTQTFWHEYVHCLFVQAYVSRYTTFKVEGRVLLNLYQ